MYELSVFKSTERTRGGVQYGRKCRNNFIHFGLIQNSCDYRRRASQPQISANAFQLSETTYQRPNRGAVHRRNRGQIQNQPDLLLLYQRVYFVFQLRTLRAAMHATRNRDCGNSIADFVSDKLHGLAVVYSRRAASEMVSAFRSSHGTCGKIPKTQDLGLSAAGKSRGRLADALKFGMSLSSLVSFKL